MYVIYVIPFQGISVVVSTYILCGFGSIAAMGINLGALSAAEPRKRQDFAKLMLRTLVAGNVACFMTACVAGKISINGDVLVRLSSTQVQSSYI
jgi:nucleoside permease NupC